jgi:heat shock protein HtpX
MFNQLKTVLLLGTLSGILLLLGGLFAGTTGVTIAFILALLMNAVSYFYSDKIVLSMYKAQPLSESQFPELYSMVGQLTKRMNLPMPKLWIVNTQMANAFATGRNPNHSSVVVTNGILSILDMNELRAVLAHELGHVQNRDILVSTIAATIATAIGYVASMAKYASFFSSSDGRRRSNPIGLLIAALLMPLAATLIQLSISRSREYLADETGAHVCEDPLALASALSKLEKHIPQAHLDSQDTLHASTAPLFIVHPFLNEGLMTLFMTHPPTRKRIERLQSIYKEMKNQ